MPFRIHCDYSREFDVILKDLCKLYGIKLTYSRLGHLQIKGYLKRMHLTPLEIVHIHRTKYSDKHPLKDFLQAVIAYNKSQFQ